MDHIFKRALLTAALALTALTALAGTATASRSLSLSPGGAFTMVSQGLISFSVPRGDFERIDIHCTVTLTGTLNRLIAKRSGTQFGQITGATYGPSAGNRCGNTIGETSIAQPLGLPWSLAYSTFSGRLPTPNLLTFSIQGMSTNLTINNWYPAGGCTTRGDVPINIGFTGTSPNTSGTVVPSRHTMPLISGNTMGLFFVCTRSAQIVGRFSITPTQTLILIN